MPIPRRAASRRPKRRTATRARRRARRPGSAVVILLTTVPARAASGLVAALLRARVAACVNLVPGVTSTFRGKGKVVRALEALLLVKTTARSERICRRVLERAQPYDVPEVLAVRADRANRAFARWAQASAT